MDEIKLPDSSAAEDIVGYGLADTLLRVDRPLLLIIEDHLDVVQYLRSFLDKTYRLDVATNGQEGWDKALEIVPDNAKQDWRDGHGSGCGGVACLSFRLEKGHAPRQADHPRGRHGKADRHGNRPEGH